jgi:RecA/RadA recombinase
MVKMGDGLSTGSTLLNLACSGNPFAGFFPGKYYFIVGDSHSGKTFLGMSCFAEAMQNKRYRDYRLIFDDVEGGNLFDVGRLFGKRVSDRMESPCKNGGNSATIDEFYFNIDDALSVGKPFIYVLDSMDCLTSKEENEKFADNKKAFRKGTQMTGSYGDGKAKKNSANLRRLLKPLEESGSILIILNQTRDNIGFGFEKKTRSGGHSLGFYATLEMWSSVRGKIKKSVRGKARVQGTLVEVKIKKNRVNGTENIVQFPIFPSYGIDDTLSCIRYLLGENYWKKSGATIHAPEFEIKGSEQSIVAFVEKHNLQREFTELVGEVWNEIQEEIKIKRKPRYE